MAGWADNGKRADAVLYSGDAIVDLGVLAAPYDIASFALGINNEGQVVGQSNSSFPDSAAFLYSGGAMLDLNSMISPSSGWQLTTATAINDNGQIVGYGTNPSGQTDAFLLTPTPEPSAFVLLAVGAVALIGYRWRRRR